MTFLQWWRWAITWQWSAWREATESPFFMSGYDVGGDRYWCFGPLEVWRRET
jgi:hypothetical protein